MGNPVVVAAQMAARGDEVARLRADLLAARADAAEQSRLRVEVECERAEARAERDRLAARVRELEEEGLAFRAEIGGRIEGLECSAAHANEERDQAAALLRRAVGWTVHVAGEESALEDGWLADARAFLGGERG